LEPAALLYGCGLKTENAEHNLRFWTMDWLLGREAIALSREAEQSLRLKRQRLTLLTVWQIDESISQHWETACVGKLSVIKRLSG
jgi:hypothetical protein